MISLKMRLDLQPDRPVRWCSIFKPVQEKERPCGMDGMRLPDSVRLEFFCWMAMASTIQMMLRVLLGTKRPPVLTW
jgi:hypothetical protein